MAQQESRVKKTLLNARVNLIFYFLTLCLSFFSRKIFLDCLGANFVGLTGTLQNLLGFLNLAELGIGSAIGYLLYKPLFDHNQTKITEILSVMGYLYRWIGLIILAAGLILSCFLPLIFSDRDTGFQLPLIYFSYYSFLISTLIGYFINYRQNLLSADQRNYVVTAYFQSAAILKTIIQMVFAYYTSNFYLWIIIELGFSIIYSVILNWKINQTYPWLKSSIQLGKKLYKKYPEVMVKTKQLFYHKIGGVVQFQLAPVLIYSFGSLFLVAAYQSYQIVTIKLNSLINNALGGTRASIGNLVAEDNISRTLSVYWELLSFKTYIAGIATMSLYFFINPFIALWIGNEYILPDNILIMILIISFIDIYRWVNEDFLYGFGLFWDVWAPIVEAGINIIVAIALGYYLGLFGVLMGNVSSLILIVCIWRPYMLFRWGFKIALRKYWLHFFKILSICICPIIVINKIRILLPLNPYSSIINYILYVFVLLSMYILITYPLVSYFTTGLKRVNSRIDLLSWLKKWKRKQ